MFSVFRVPKGLYLGLVSWAGAYGKTVQPDLGAPDISKSNYML